MKEHFKYKVVQNLINSGGEIFLVGGCVRDYLMRKNPKDIDIIVRLLPLKELIFILEQTGKVDLVGESFGVIKYKDEECDLEIALPRKDELIVGGRGHKGIQSTSDCMLPLEADLKRRDFKFNSIAMDINGEIIDPFNGIQDIMNGIVSCTDKDAFVEDPLRIMRALQFAVRFGFEIEKETFDLMLKHKPKLKDITGERKLIELEKGLNGNILYFHLLLRNFDEEVFGLKMSSHPLFQQIKTISEFLFSSFNQYGDYVSSDFFVKKLRIDNKTKDEFDSLMKAFKLLKGSLSNYEKRSHLFECLKKTHIVLDCVFFKSTELNNIIEEFRIGFFPKNMNELDISGDDLIELGFEGKEIGDKKKELLQRIFRKEIDNKNLIELCQKKN